MGFFIVNDDSSKLRRGRSPTWGDHHSPGKPLSSLPFLSLINVITAAFSLPEKSEVIPDCRQCKARNERLLTLINMHLLSASWVHLWVQEAARSGPGLGCLAPRIVLMALKASCQVSGGRKEITFSRSERRVILRSFCFRFDEEIGVNYAKNGVRGRREMETPNLKSFGARGNLPAPVSLKET